MKKVILKIRDKLWYYTIQMDPSDTEESNYKSFKLRFSLFFIIPVLLFIYLILRIIAVISKIIPKIADDDYLFIFPIGLIFFYLFWFFLFKPIFKTLENVPFNLENDSGFKQNRNYVMGAILLELFFFYIIIYLIFQIK